jgi:hypothetical protein
MMIAVKYVFGHPGTGRLIFRRQFPKHLRHLIPNGHQGVKRSLGAKELSAPGAAKALSDAREEYDRLVAQAHKVATGNYDRLDPPTTAYLAALYAHNAELDDERSRKGLSPIARPYASRRDPEDDWRESRAMLEAFDRPGLVEHWGAWVAEYTCDLGHSFDAASEDFGDLCEAIAEAACELWLTLDKRIEPEGPIAAPTRAKPAAPPENARSKVTPLHLMPLFEEYAKRREMTEGVRAEYRGFVTMLIARIGHDDARLVTVDDMRQWRDNMLDTPARKGKPLDARTVAKRIGSFKSLFRWAVSNGRLASNPCATVDVIIPRKAKLRERAFTPQEAHTILRATLMPAPPRLTSGHRLARRWIPWLCA